MKRYRSSTPRATVALAAAVMTALTIGLLVVGPVQTDGRNAAPAIIAASGAAGKPATEVAIHPSRIDVVATRVPGPLAQIEKPLRR